MKKRIIVGLFLAVSLMMTACGGASDSKTTTAAETKTEAEATTAAGKEASTDKQEVTDVVKDAKAEQFSGAKNEEKKSMALFMSHMTNEFVKTLSSSVQKEAEELGYTGDSFKIYDGKNDVVTQVSQIEQAVTLGVDGIIIEPVSTDGIVKAVKDAEKAGVKVVILNQRISDQNAADTFVGADNESTGAALMKKVMEDLDGKGNIVELLGPMGSDGQVGRSKGFDSVLAEYPDVKVVASDSADWDTAKALTLTENWLTSSDIQAVVAQNDGMAVGAAQAVKEAGLTDKIKVYGVDATSDGLNAIANGGMTGTVSQGTEDQGKISADLCSNLIYGQSVPKEVIATNVVYTKENVNEILKK